MANTQEPQRQSTFHLDIDEDVSIRKLTETGTLFTDVGKSHFFAQNQDNHKHKDTVQRKRSQTGSTVTQAGQSQFFSKPSVEELAYTPPHIITKRIKPLRKLTKTGTIKFPQLKEFAHFHYNKVNIGSILMYIDTDNHVKKGSHYNIFVQSSGVTWVVQRNVEHFILLDRQIHYCVFDRKYSQLADIETRLSEDDQNTTSILSEYLVRFSALTGNSINCGTVLNFFELNNNGGRLISPLTDSAINIPAVANAIVTKAYHACDFDELELKEGDLVSVIDKPPASESSWWRGKKELAVGFFPSECVEVIGTRKSSVSAGQPTDQERLPVLRKRDKIISFLQQFFRHRPALSQLKQSGIVKERLFGSDLGEYLTNSGQLVPRILVCCCEAIERHGLIDGIYRLSGRVTQVQLLRDEFDLDKHECFMDDDLLDIHTVSTLVKTYFRELPNPLLTYQLYEALVSCVQLRQKRKQVSAIKAHISTLPPTHYRTAKYLFAHLARLTVYSKRTSMTSRNLAIVWAPNLIRYDESTGTLNAFGVLQNVSLQAAVTDIMISNYDTIFAESSREERFSPFDQKPLVQSLSKRLVRLSVARRRKGDVARQYNSSADFPIIHSIPMEEATDLHAKSTSRNMSRSQSLSLDSVFTSSSSNRVHLLEGPRNGKPSIPIIRPQYENVNPERKAKSSYHSSNECDAISSSALMSNGSEPSENSTAAVTKPIPLPKPRPNKKVHDYVNLFVLRETGKVPADQHFPSSRPLPVVRPKPNQTKNSSHTYSYQTSSGPVMHSETRPFTMCDAKGPAEPQQSRPYSLATDSLNYGGYVKGDIVGESLHYAVSNIYPEHVPVSSFSTNSNNLAVNPLNGTPIIAEIGVSKFCDKIHNTHTSTRTNAKVKFANNNIPSSDNGDDDEDYDNNVAAARSTGVYQNVQLPSSHKRVSYRDSLPVPALSHHQSLILSFSNPRSSDQDVILKDQRDSCASADSESYTDYQDA